MKNYDLLKPYVYSDFEDAESDESNKEGHCFVPIEKNNEDDIKKAEELLKISFPPTLLQLYNEIGIGQLYTENRDDYRYQYALLCPYQIIALYFEEYVEDYEFGGSRTDIMETLKDGKKLCFMQASEHDFFQINLDDESIWIFGKKVADSLYEFLETQLTSPIKN